MKFWKLQPLNYQRSTTVYFNIIMSLHAAPISFSYLNKTKGASYNTYLALITVSVLNFRVNLSSALKSSIASWQWSVIIPAEVNSVTHSISNWSHIKFKNKEQKIIYYFIHFFQGFEGMDKYYRLVVDSCYDMVQVWRIQLCNRSQVKFANEAVFQTGYFSMCLEEAWQMRRGKKRDVKEG